MPYITKEAREVMDSPFSVASTPGQLNYKVTKLLTKYIEIQGLSYQTINDIVGALEGAKMEFYRRVAVPYENAKMAESGDVY